MFLISSQGAHGSQFPTEEDNHTCSQSCALAKIRHKLGCLETLRKASPTLRPGTTSKAKIPEHLAGVRDLGSRLGTWLLPKLILAQTVDFSTQLPLTSTVTTLNIAALSGQTFQLDIPSRFLNAVSIQL